MNKTFITIIFTIGLIGLVFWFSGVDLFPPGPIAVNSPVVRPEAIEVVTPTASVPAPASVAAPTPALVTAAASTTSPLAREKQKLLALRQTLQNLTAQHQRSLQQQTTSVRSRYSSQVSRDSEQIQNLVDLLQDDRLAENDVNEAAAIAMRDQSSAAQVARDEVDLNIKSIEQAIQQTQEQIYSEQFTGYIASEQEVRFGSLQNLLQMQLQQLAELRAQRVDISASVLNQSRAIASEADQQKSELVSEEGSIRSQIENLRDEILRLQGQREQSRATATPLDEQLRQAQQNYRDQELRVRELERQL